MEAKDYAIQHAMGHVHDFGVITLPLLPSTWTHAREDDYSVFYVEGEKLRALRAFSRMYSNKKPATAADVRGLCEKIASEMSNGSPILWGEIEDATPIVTFECDSPDGVEPITLTAWLVGRLISPNQLQVVFYTFAVHIDIAQSAEIVTERNLVDVAVRGATYWDECDRVYLEDEASAKKPSLFKRLFRRI